MLSRSQNLHTYDLLVHRRSPDCYQVRPVFWFQPGNSTLFSRLLLEAVAIKLKTTLNYFSISCVARNIKSAFGLGHHDGFINSHITIRLVLSNSFESPNPNSALLSDVGMKGAVTFSSITSQLDLRTNNISYHRHSRQPEPQQHSLLVIEVTITYVLTDERIICQFNISRQIVYDIFLIGQQVHWNPAVSPSILS